MEKPLILLVDDNSKNLQVLGHQLEGIYKTAIARNGEEALEFVKKRLPDIILLDVAMPGMSGFEVCERLKASPETREIPVIFLTARTDTEDVIKGFEVGGVDYVTKPFRKEELLARVKTHLSLQEQKLVVDKYAALLEKRNIELQEKNVLLSEKNAQLEELNTSKDKFFSIIAHDLRDPLSSLHNLTEIITENLESYPRDMLIRFLKTQRDAVKNLLTLLGNLLTWSRLQRGMIECSPQQINVGNIITQNITLFMPNAEQKQITLSSSIPEKVLAYADQSMMNTVVRNLISNALKFTDSGGTITVSVRQDDTCINVSVADTGIGIDAKHVPQLFQVDAKYQRKGTANEQGTGLGLILCKEFVERHGGKIRVKSDIGKGTTFTFSLPLPQNPSQTHRQPEHLSGGESDQEPVLDQY